VEEVNVPKKLSVKGCIDIDLVNTLHEDTVAMRTLDPATVLHQNVVLITRVIDPLVSHLQAGVKNLIPEDDLFRAIDPLLVPD
jgi:hypothetical protein